MVCSGKVRMGRRTKELIGRLQAGEIAVICHRDIDEIAAVALCERKIKAVVNCSTAITGRYPNPGPKILLERGIVLIHLCPETLLEQLEEGDFISIVGDTIYCREQMIAQGKRLSLPDVLQKMQEATVNVRHELDCFISNTLDYAAREKDLILGQLLIPEIEVDLKDRQVLIVVRGKNYKEDLQVIKPYINEIQPVLIGVDGGADVLLEAGYRPQMIIGDMDSVSDKTLQCGAELLVHAYTDGRAPGIERLEKLGLKASLFPAPGTSEDVALLLAYEKEAALIVAVGTHTSMLDFLEKGRPGMGSTFLVRLKVGAILVDAKGVSKLYQRRKNHYGVVTVFIAALVPIFIILDVVPLIQQVFRLLTLKIRIILGW